MASFFLHAGAALLERMQNVSSSAHGAHLSELTITYEAVIVRIARLKMQFALDRITSECISLCCNDHLVSIAGM